MSFLHYVRMYINYIYIHPIFQSAEILRLRGTFTYKILRNFFIFRGFFYSDESDMLLR